MTPYRSLASAPVRPALSWWQRVLCASMPETWLARARWYRCHIGGAWTFYGGPRDLSLPFDPRAWQRRTSETCAICNLCERLRAIPRWLLRPGEAGYLHHHDDHRCEVYQTTEDDR